MLFLYLFKKRLLTNVKLAFRLNDRAPHVALACTQQSMSLLERLRQKEALLHVIVRRVRRVDVLHAREASTHPAVLVDGL